MKKAVCFDFDGVIINSSGVQRGAFIESYHRATGKIADEKMIETFFGHSGDSLSNIFRKMNLPLEMIGYYREVSIEKNEKVRTHEGMKELLSYLRERGILCGLCTGKDRERTIMILKKKGLASYFNAIVCSDDVINPKPDPESLLILMQKMNVNKENMIMVGDANNDIRCAKSAGVLSIGVTWGDVKKEILLGADPDYIADEVFELKTYINEILGITQRKKYLFNDFIVAEDKCNMKCEYCLTQTSQFKKEREKNCFDRVKLSDFTYREGTKFQKRLDSIQSNLLNELDVAILKISGGEILMLPEIQHYILKQAKKYKGVQVLTNGVLLNEKILKEYKEAGNICLQISLDYHTIEGNYYRTKKKEVLEKILHNIDLAYHLGVPVEINCVLTDKNTGILSHFLDYLNQYEKGVIVYPFPVRGIEKKSFFMEKEQIKEIEKIVDNYDKYKNILAPQAYMLSLLDFLQTGKRTTNCYLPFIAVGVFDDGTVTPCPNYWFTSLGSILEDKRKVISKIGNSGIYKMLSSKRKIANECQSCFTPWESFNLYIEGGISYEDLIKSPSYAFEGAREYIETIKQNIVK